MDPISMTNDPLHNVQRPKLFPRRFTFSVRLDGEDWFFPSTAFAVTEEKAKSMIIDRFNGKIAAWK